MKICTYNEAADVDRYEEGRFRPTVGLHKLSKGAGEKGKVPISQVGSSSSSTTKLSFSQMVP